MSKLEKIIQYHIDNNLSSVQARFLNSLDPDELAKVRAVLKLNAKLQKVKVSPGYGKKSFESTLRMIEPDKENNIKRFRIFQPVFIKAGLTLSALAIVVSAFGLNFLSNSNKGSSSNKLSSISANGTVDSISSINLADVESEQAQLQTESKSVESVKNELVSAENNMSEAINENF